MTAVLPERDLDVLDVVRSVHDDLDLPEGYRAEIIGGQIAVSASPLTRHALVVDEVREAVNHALPTGYRAYDHITLETPEGDRYIPDLGAWPTTLLRELRNKWILPAQDCVFVLEVTSPRHESRDYGKAKGYAGGAVAVYLLVDFTIRQCVLHTEPTSRGYRSTTPIPFGEDVVISFAEGSTAHIDTSTF